MGGERGAHGPRRSAADLACPCADARLPQVPGKYTVTADSEKGGPGTLAVKGGDVVEVVEEGAEGLW